MIEDLYSQAARYLAHLTKDEPEEVKRAARDAFEKKTKNLEAPRLGIAGQECSLNSKEVQRVILHNGMVAAREVVLRERSDRRYRETGIIQSEQQVFEMASSVFGSAKELDKKYLRRGVTM